MIHSRLSISNRLACIWCTCQMYHILNNLRDRLLNKFIRMVIALCSHQDRKICMKLYHLQVRTISKLGPDGYITGMHHEYRPHIKDPTRCISYMSHLYHLLLVLWTTLVFSRQGIDQHIHHYSVSYLVNRASRGLTGIIGNLMGILRNLALRGYSRMLMDRLGSLRCTGQ